MLPVWILWNSNAFFLSSKFLFFLSFLAKHQIINDLKKHESHYTFHNFLSFFIFYILCWNKKNLKMEIKLDDTRSSFILFCYKCDKNKNCFIFFQMAVLLHWNWFLVIKKIGYLMSKEFVMFFWIVIDFNIG